jgi:hypothetical protein
MADAPLTIDAVYRVAGIVSRENIPFAFIGGVALGAWGIPRGTFDLDLALSLERKRTEDLLAAFERDGLVLDPAFARGFRDRVGGMELIHVYLPAGATLAAVDVFFAETPFLRSVLARRTTVDLGRGPVPICSAADLLLLKLFAGRLKDRADLENLITTQGFPERAYLETWAGELGIRDRLDRLLAGEA